ncbi:hypothetical protein EHQ92_00495 [Leptospira biflexa]|uniref:hypothetical protein n=1 Tax=Leptospira biflexa TaxID=172 RepID=UPI001090C8A9|nr:hypothetical protein [Leptospira biflexa]TGM42889.1 hypothetical protein EHQ88_18210 [Leptospira biflexa]TGM51233.1 hypothetical protein EHQ92_00495 [Leptospira biflexa]
MISYNLIFNFSQNYQKYTEANFDAPGKEFFESTITEKPFKNLFKLTFYYSILKDVQMKEESYLTRFRKQKFQNEWRNNYSEEEIRHYKQNLPYIKEKKLQFIPSNRLRQKKIKAIERLIDLDFYITSINAINLPIDKRLYRKLNEYNFSACEFNAEIYDQISNRNYWNNLSIISMYPFHEKYTNEESMIEGVKIPKIELFSGEKFPKEDCHRYTWISETN